MAQKSPVSSLEIVSGLIREPLFDEQKMEYTYPKNSQWIVGSHGTHIGQVLNLVKHGKIKGGSPDLVGEFYITPNLGYPGWSEVGLQDELLDPRFKHTDYLLKGIGYSQSADRTEWIQGVDDKEYVSDGVVFMFGKMVLKVEGIELICTNEEDMDAELVLPKVPSVEAILGIHPVDGLSAKSLQIALGTLVNS